MKTLYPYSICLLCILAWLGTCVGCDKKTGEDSKEPSLLPVTYESSNEKFPNPERGFYHQMSSDLGTGINLLDDATLKKYRKDNFSLIMRMYYLKGFRDKPLSAQVFDDFDKDMATLRRNGVKCILRFAYSEAEDEPDAPLALIQQHLDQLKPYIEKNADIIAVVQAGLIGAWGEWYYTSNKLNTPAAQATVLNKLLEVVPTRRMIQVRTPNYKTRYLQTSEALKRSEAFTGSKAARLGHHNDCFMASPDDYGTYQNVEADKTYLNKEGIYVPIGGETCPPSGIDPADCAKAQAEMRKLHWTFLNEDYYRGVNDQWITQGCMDNIIRELGYRFELISGEYSGQIAPGSTLHVNMKIINQGYASLFNPRLVELILVNNQSGESYLFNTGIDPRFWQPETETDLQISAGIPQSIAEGEYNLYLNMPDPEESLYGNPAYSVRFANQAVWNDKNGYNNLNMKIKIQSDATPDIYSGELIFKKKQ